MFFNENDNYRDIIKLFAQLQIRYVTFTIKIESKMGTLKVC